MATKNSTNEYFKAWGGDFKTPAFDVNKLFALQRRNIEALSTANQVMIEGAQAIAKRQSELLRSQVEQLIATSKDIFTMTAPETNSARQSELAKSMYESAVSGAREISEMASKSSFEALDVLNKRAAQSMEEISSAARAA